MDIESFSQNVGQQFGALEKAIIEIIPKATGSLEKADPVKIAGAGKKAGFGSISGNFTSIAKGVGTAALNAGLNAAKSLASSALDLDMGEKKLENAIQVQFNPATINFDASATLPSKQGKEAQADSGKEGPSRRDQVITFLASNNVNIRMNVELIFNDVDNNDAFLEEKLSPISGDIAKSAAKSAVKALGKKKVHSVKDKVMALTFLARNSTIRQVCFNWGKLRIPGIVEGVDVKYTMFNPNGEPIHATVGLSLLVLNEDSSKSEWLDVYKEAFGMGTGHIKARDRGPLADTLGKAGNLFNI